MVHPQARRLLEEAEDHLPLAEPVDHHRGGPEVHPVGRHPHQMRRDPVELDHQHPDPFGPRRQLDPEQRLDRHREHQFVGERREVVHAGDVGRPLHVGEFLAGLLHPGVEVPDHRFGPEHRLAVELDHQTEHTVGRGVLGPHVDDHGLVVGALDVDVGGIEGRALGEAEDRSDLAPELPGLGGPPTGELLAALGGLGDETLGGAGGGGLEECLARDRFPERRVRVGRCRRLVRTTGGEVGSRSAHLGPGAPLNWTGTRPTP